MTLKPTHYIIDSGNTFLKVAYYQEKNLLKVERHSNVENIKLDSSLPGLFCSVNHDHLFSHLTNLNDIKDKLVFPTKYEESLGIDRKVLIYDFLKLRNLEKGVIVDAGSFITVDFIEDKHHLGGYIFPGLSNFLNTYHEKGKKLPKLSMTDALKNKTQRDLPNTTHEAISMAFIHYISSITNLLKDHGPIYLTGGDAKEMMGFLSQYDLNLEDNLMIESLNRVYLDQSNQR